MSRFILAIDQGTTNTKVLAVDDGGQILARASRPVSISYPRPGWVEQDPDALWRSVEEAIEECLGSTSGDSPAAVAVTNQRETVMVWERATGRPAGPCVVWQCNRGAEFCDQLRGHGLEETIRGRTGLTIDPMFSGSKMRWLLDHIDDGAGRSSRGELCVGTVDSWVLWNLTGGVHACDTTNASRTQLLDLRALSWDGGLCEIFGVPQAALPEVKPSGSLFGETRTIGRLRGGIPIASMIGDSHAAHFGHTAFRPGAVKATYGTGSSLMTATEEVVASRNGLSSTVAFALPDRVLYALEGNIYATGAAVHWFGDFLGLNEPAAGVADLAQTVADNGGVYLVPAFVGLGAPYWNDRARGLLTGLTRGTTRAHVARAAVESVAFQIRDVFAAIEADVGSELPALLADGGASRNRALMQFQSDVLERPVLRSDSADLSALGAAYLAGWAIGMWRSLEEVAALPRTRERFEPRMKPAVREGLLAGWRAAVARAVTDTQRDVSN